MHKHSVLPSPAASFLPRSFTRKEQSRITLQNLFKNHVSSESICSNSSTELFEIPFAETCICQINCHRRRNVCSKKGCESSLALCMQMGDYCFIKIFSSFTHISAPHQDSLTALVALTYFWHGTHQTLQKTGKWLFTLWRIIPNDAVLKILVSCFLFHHLHHKRPMLGTGNDFCDYCAICHLTNNDTSTEAAFHKMQNTSRNKILQLYLSCQFALLPGEIQLTWKCQQRHHCNLSFSVFCILT